MLWQGDSGLFALARTCPALECLGCACALCCLLCPSGVMLLTQENPFSETSLNSISLPLLEGARLSAQGHLGAFDKLFAL